MAEIRIPVELLPPPNINGDHAIQFRIVSDDKTKTSSWSPTYVVKSTGQYRPTASAVTTIKDTLNNTLSCTWDTPTYYNNSGSVVIHNHTQNYKQHPTDIFIQYPNISSDFQFHERVISDNTVILFPAGSSLRVVGLIATHGIEKYKNSSGKYSSTFIDSLISRMKIFDTGVV